MRSTAARRGSDRRSQAARALVRVREARRAYRRFHAECLWSCDLHDRVGPANVARHRLGREGARASHDRAVAWTEKNRPLSRDLKRLRAEANEVLETRTD